MNDELELMIDKMVNNYEVLRKNFLWEQDLSKHLIALQYALENKTVDVAQIKLIKKQLKEKTGVFSNFRGTSMFAICGLLAATSTRPESQLEAMIDNQSKLKEAGFKNSQYLPTALYALSSLNIEESTTLFLEKAYKIYREMKSNHPFLTSGDDYALAILLATCDHSVFKIEDYYTALSKGSFLKSNGLQMLSHIMAFHEGHIVEQTRKLDHIYKVLKANKIKPYDKAYPALGLISLLDDSELALNSFIDLVKYLKKIKRYKWLDRNMIMLIASALLTHNSMGNDLSKTTLQVTVQSIVAAQQAAMIAAVSAASAASAAT